MLEYDFSNSVNYWTWRTSRAFERAMKDELVPHGISWRQCQVLAWLALEGELTQSDLSEKIGIDRPTLVGLLDRMERDGWIRRRTSSTDRRKKLISPTDVAEPIWAKIVQCAIRVRTRATYGLSEVEVENLKRMLSIVEKNLSQQAAEEVA